MQGVAENLARCVAILNMFGFSIYELQNKVYTQKPYVINKKDIIMFYDSYI